jgi:hypothetical protein
VHGIIYLFYAVTWIFSYACGVHASNIVEKSFVFELEIRELSLGTAVCLSCGWLGVLQPIYVA